MFEYVVDAIPDDNNGAPDLTRIKADIAARAAQDWRLVSTTTNELGRNSSSSSINGIGSGTNSTIDVTLLFFEREIGTTESTREIIMRNNVYHPSALFRVTDLILSYMDKKEVRIKLYGVTFKDETADSILADVIVESKVKEPVIYRDVAFEADSTRDHYVTFAPAYFPSADFVAVKTVIIKPKAYYNRSELIRIDPDEYENVPGSLLRAVNHFDTTVVDYERTDTHWLCVCGHKNSLSAGKCELCGRMDSVVEASESSENSGSYTTIKSLKEIRWEIRSCESAQEVIRYLDTYSINNNYVNVVVVPKIREFADLEKKTGNQKRQLIEWLEKNNQI